ncbi:MAG: hypothetical protein HKN20_17295 [Gemmatimonadetes bacterium]|nr:hypothetical protein [Gemmatimonadota bacterium]
MFRLGILSLALIVAFGFGCAKKESTDNTHTHADGTVHEGDHAEAPEPAASTPPAELEAGYVAQAGIAYKVPEGWLAETPSSSMRKAQYALPSGIPDSKGEVTLFHFGAGGGGGVDANLRRWAGQFQQPDGSDPMKVAETERMQVGEFRVSTIEVNGRYVSAMPGAPAYNEENWRLIGAVIEGPGGPWFFKGVGPEEVMTSHRDSFLEMIRSAKRAS